MAVENVKRLRFNRTVHHVTRDELATFFIHFGLASVVRW